MSQSYFREQILGKFSGQRIPDSIQTKVKKVNPNLHSELAVKEELADKFKGRNALERKLIMEKIYKFEMKEVRHIEDMLSK
jgi:hypothetical protein